MPKNNNIKDKKPDVVAMAKKKRHIHLLEKLQKNKPLTKAEIKELAEFEKGSQSPVVVNSQDLIARSFDVSIRTVARWVSEGMPVRQDGYYNILEIKDWRAARDARQRYKKTKKGRREQHADGAGPGDVSAPPSVIPDDLQGEYGSDTDWITEKDKWDAISKRMKAEKEAGLLIRREDAVEALKMAVVNVKRQFLALPKQIAPQIVGIATPAEVEHILDIRLREIIQDFAKGKF